MTPFGAFDATDVAWSIVNLLAAAVLGGAIGIQRQATHKPAGFRTHLLVALGSCAFMEASRLAGDTRIGANIITGVGFLGAGAIVREGFVPHGLTSAASIWAASAIGLALAFGTPPAYVLAIATTVLVFGSLSLTDKWIERLFPPKRDTEVAIDFDLDLAGLDAIEKRFTDRGLDLRHSSELAIVRNADRRIATWQLSIRERHGRRLREALVDVSGSPGVLALRTMKSPES